MRKEIVLKLIEKKPGISYNKIVHETCLSNGVISHYLIKLLESGEIEKEGLARGKYFLKGVPKKDRILITLLRNKTNNDIFRLLINDSSKINKNFSANEIAKSVKKSGPTVSVSLKILLKNNIIERIIMNKNSKLTSDIAYVISNKKMWTTYLVKHNL